MSVKELYSILNSEGELIGNYWAIRPHWAGKKALKQIFRNTGIKDDVIFEIFNRMKKKIYRFKGNVKKVNPRNENVSINPNFKIKKFFSYEITRI